MLVLVFGFVLVRVDRAVVVFVRVLVLGRIRVFVLVIVIGVAVLVGVLHAVSMLVRMFVLVSHGGRIRAAGYGRPAARNPADGPEDRPPEIE